MILSKSLKSAIDKFISSGEIFDFHIVSMKDLIITPKVRFKCMNGCENYGKLRKCPPKETLSPEECKSYLLEYSKVILIRFKPQNDNSIDPNVQKTLLALEKEAFLSNYRFGVAVFPTHCHQCENCSIQSSCENLLHARPSITSLCIDILGTLENLNLGQKILRNKTNPQKFYYVGMLLLE